MPDIFTKKRRSEIMSGIRSHGNEGTEIALAKLLRAYKITGWRRQGVLRIDGKVRSSGLARRARINIDFIFSKQRVVIFVDGCFWHYCPKHGHIPKGNAIYWRPKLIRNRNRDRNVTRHLRHRGWRVIRIWEHELTHDPDRCLQRIQQVLISANE